MVLSPAAAGSILSLIDPAGMPPPGATRQPDNREGRTIFRLGGSGQLGPMPATLGGRRFWRRDEIAAWVQADCPRREIWLKMARERGLGHQYRRLLRGLMDGAKGDDLDFTFEPDYRCAIYLWSRDLTDTGGTSARIDRRYWV